MPISQRGYIEQSGDDFLVGTKGTGEYKDYIGPQAHVYVEGGWLYVVTDEYEGSVMLNVEVLPFLRRALAKIAKSRALAAKEETP